MEYSAAIASLRDHLFAIQPLPSAAWAAMAGIWKPFSAGRKTVLTPAGEVEKYLYYVTAGVQRVFYLHDNGKDATLVLTYPFSFSGIADSFLTGRPSACCLETLTASSFLRTSYAQLAELMDAYRDIERLIFKATAFAFGGVLERQIELQCYSAEEKFRALLKRSPHVLQLIPHKYLASYLGIDPTTFSKLLGSIRI
jgi:CRP-like cAMP-binding protein